MDRQGKTINVLCIHSTDRVGGPGRNILEFLDREGKHGVRTIMATFARRGDATNDFIEEVRRRSCPLVVLNEAFRFDPRPIYQVAGVLRREDIHIIQSHGYKGNMICLLLRAVVGFRFRWIAFFHGWTFQNRRVQIYHGMDKILMRFADCLVTVARTGARLFRRLGVPKSKIHVIPNTIDPALYERRASDRDLRHGAGAADDEKLVGVIGRLSPEKGQREFIAAFRSVAAERSDAKAVLIGEGPLEAELRTMLREYNLEGRVRLLGHRDDIPEVLSALDVLVLPSWSENMPNAVLEAMAAGVPIVATTVGAVPDMVSDGRSALLAPPRDPEALARAMVRMLSDPGLGPRLARRARRDVARYHPDRRAEMLVSLYRQLVHVA